MERKSTYGWRTNHLREAFRFQASKAQLHKRKLRDDSAGCAIFVTEEFSFKLLEVEKEVHPNVVASLNVLLYYILHRA